MKTAIITYSLGGNTRSVATKMKEWLDADIYEIKTKVPYPQDYDQMVEQGKIEVESGFMPEIEELNIDFSKYDNIVLGSPVWWYTFAPAMNAYLKNADFLGKKVYVFATNGGWLGHTLKDYEKKVKNAKISGELNIRFNGTKLVTPIKEIENFAKSIN